MKNLFKGEGIYLYKGIYFRLYRIKPSLGYLEVVVLEKMSYGKI